MNRYIFSVSLLSCTTVISILPFTARVNAQTVNSGQVEMTATVGGFCLFENEIDGTLGVPTGDLARLDSGASANNITALDGAAGSIDVTCNDATSTINIDTVTETNTAGATVNTYTTTVSGLATDIRDLDRKNCPIVW